MVFYYALHHALPEDERFTGGKRNCATFLYGSVLYAVLLAVLRAVGGRRRWADAVASSIGLVWLADGAVMAYTYKAYYGRSIVHEAADPALVANKWSYDPTAHLYSIVDPARDRDAQERQARAAAIVQRKREIRAAKTLQRWWRDRLYSPPHGIVYLRALRSFSAASALPTPEAGSAEAE
jgi:hypothetical protein